VLVECLQQTKWSVESNGKEGKSPRLDLRYKRNSTHEYERNTKSLDNGEKHQQWCEEHNTQKN